MFANWFQIIDSTTLIDSRFEPRASLDILFRMADIYTDMVGNIDTVQYTENFYNPDNSLVYTSENLIPPA